MNSGPSFMQRNKQSVETEGTADNKPSSKLCSKIVVQYDNDRLTDELDKKYLNNPNIDVVSVNYSTCLSPSNNLCFSALIIYREVGNTLGNSAVFK